MIRIVFLISIFFFVNDVYCQEVVNVLKVNELLDRKVNFKASSQTSISLPFLDDFSGNLSYPDNTLWEDNHVFINRTYPINPLSLGVATFDGLDSLGFPYNINSTTLNGEIADYLTSRARKSPSLKTLALVNKNAALLVEDDQASCKLVNDIIKLLYDQAMQIALSTNIKKIAKKDATDDIVKICLEMLKDEYK